MGAVAAKIMGVCFILMLFMVAFIFLWNYVLRPLLFKEKLDEITTSAGEEYIEKKVKKSANTLLEEDDED